MKITVIIPVYNERDTVLLLISKVQQVRLEKEIIVVDDGSSDGTRKILKESFKNPGEIKLILHSRNCGKGKAVRSGLKKATGDVIIIQDADLEYNPNDYHKLIKPIKNGKAQVVYGSRFLGKRLRLYGNRPTIMPLHWIANRFLTIMTNALYSNGLTDMETCYKVFTKEVIMSLKLQSNRFDIEPEITAKVLKRGHKILEIPIRQNPRTYKEGKKITWKDGVVAFYTLLKYRILD